MPLLVTQPAKTAYRTSAYRTKEQRDHAVNHDRQMLVEELRFHIIADLRQLSAKTGTKKAKAWLQKNWIELAF